MEYHKTVWTWNFFQVVFTYAATSVRDQSSLNFTPALNSLYESDKPVEMEFRHTLNSQV